MKILRRNVLQFAGAMAVSARCAVAQQKSSEIEHEFQRGDPLGPQEHVSFDRSSVMRNIRATKADYLPRHSGSGFLLDEARQFLGINRAGNQQVIADFLEIFGLPFADSQNRPFAFCAAGIGYVAARAYARNKRGAPAYADIIQCLGEVDHYHFFPSPGVANMVTVAQVHGRWVPVRNVVEGKTMPLPGWLVVFKWNRTDHHVGIVKTLHGTSLETVEFNTSPEGATGSQANGGAVAERKRDIRYFVTGFINPQRPIST